jgi:hypothetical protein
MIQANELRIGNWVLDRHDNWQRVDVVVKDKSGAYSVHFKGTKVWGDYCGTLNPIILSPEILKKCDFKATPSLSYKTGITIPYTVWSKEKLVYNEIQKQWWFKGVLDHQPQYLHHLQNLYFALTGKELEIKF